MTCDLLRLRWHWQRAHLAAAAPDDRLDLDQAHAAIASIGAEAWTDRVRPTLRPLGPQ